MRIISGTRKGFKLASPKGRLVRPTSDSVKELMFNVIRDHVRGSQVLDVYAGTGSLGIEALSRGAASAVFVENNNGAQRLIKTNLFKTGFTELSEIFSLSAVKAIKKFASLSKEFDLVFADPPYEAGFSPEVVNMFDQNNIVASRGWLIVEHDVRTVLKSTQRLILKICKKQGDTGISFYQNGA